MGIKVVSCKEEVPIIYRELPKKKKPGRPRKKKGETKDGK